MFLITSAAYVSPALVSEFGKLPPAMLPVQNRRLFEHQLDLVAKSECGSVFLTLPKGFLPTQIDCEKLKTHNVTIVYVPESFSLGQSVVYALNVIGRYDEPLHILHGDTLFSKLESETDIYAVGQAEDDYPWATTDGESDAQIYAGYFAFSSPSSLIRHITENGYRFMSGVKAYQKEVGMKAEVLPDWMDFGLINTYYRSISKMTTQRVFNDLKVNRYSLIKYSKDSRKILAEANWFASLPKEMRHYAPALWDSGVAADGRGYYEIEYYFQSSLANLFVFGKNPTFVWKEIMNSCAEFINDEANFKPNNSKEVTGQNAQLYGIKTNSRLENYAKMSGVDLNRQWIINGVEVPGLLAVAEELDAEISKTNTEFATLMHGDFCFSNILYDFKSKTIRVIDPRGLDVEGHQSIYGDVRYDVAKLAHSILGMYDYIIGGNFTYVEKEPYSVELYFPADDVIKAVQEYFRSMNFVGHTLKELSTYPVMIHLFLSMLPLHSDKPERQKAMLANALRLYVEYKNQQ